MTITLVDGAKQSTKSKAGRKSDKERLQIQFETEQERKRLEQLRKRAQPIQVDQRAVLAGWLIGVAVAFATSAVISFNGITSVAGLVGLSYHWMPALFFGFVEGSYLLFMLAYLILASRSERSLGAQLGMWFFAGVAIAANAYHVLKFHHWAFDTPDLWAGLVLGISAPIAVVSISKMTSRVAFARAE